MNTTYRKLDSLNNEIESLIDKTKKLEKDLIKSQDDFLSVSSNLELMVSENK